MVRVRTFSAKTVAKLNSTMSSSNVKNISAGLRVLVVDDNSTCLEILTNKLQVCGYNVTKCSSADVAVSLLEEIKDGYDLLISEVHMPCMDGLKLLEHIQLKMDLPVIMVSADDSQDVVMKAVIGGACDYLIKPVHIDILKNIWQHVVRKKMDGSSTANESKKMDKEDSSSQKKPRVIWSLDLHKKFIDAFNKLGPEKASPKKILALMNVPGLTRENVGSHLQKYRKYLEEEEEEQQQQQQQKMKGIM